MNYNFVRSHIGFQARHTTRVQRFHRKLCIYKLPDDFVSCCDCGLLHRRTYSHRELRYPDKPHPEQNFLPNTSPWLWLETKSTLPINLNSHDLWSVGLRACDAWIGWWGDGQRGGRERWRATNHSQKVKCLTF